jgi:hypothetical protein
MDALAWLSACLFSKIDISDESKFLLNVPKLTIVNAASPPLVV